MIALKLVSDGVLRGAGAMKEFMLATFSDLILRVLLSFVFASFLGVTGVWLSWAVWLECGKHTVIMVQPQSNESS